MGAGPVTHQASFTWKVHTLGENVFARTLARAIEVEGSTQSIAHLLRVPEATLLRWCEGRADMPIRAFTALVEFLSAAEAIHAANEPAVAPPAPQTSPESLEFHIGNLAARCVQCEGTEFRRARPDQPLKMTSRLLCRACRHEIVHGDLLVKLGRALIEKKRVEAFERNRRQAAMRASGRKLPGEEVT